MEETIEQKQPQIAERKMTMEEPSELKFLEV